MKSKVFKIGTVLLACVCLVSFIPYSVSAASSWSALPFSVTRDSSNIYDFSYSHQGVNGVNCILPPNSVPAEGTFSVTLWFTINDSVLKDNTLYDFYFTCDFFGVTPVNNGCVLIIDSTRYVLEHSTDSTYEVLLEEFEFNFSNTIFSLSFTFNDVDLDYPSWFFFKSFFRVNENNAILNGWNGGTPIDDSPISDFQDAEEGALGGKSDAEIKDEVDNALNFDFNVFDSTKIGKIHSLFDNVLDALGSSWQSLFVLSLTLGLGAFLIGRRYG